MTLQPGTWNITIYQGATFDETLTITGLNLTGFDARMQIRESHTSSNVTLTLDTGANGGLTLTVVDTSNATLDIAIAADDTAAIAAGTYVYDLELFNSSTDVVYRLLEGNVIVMAEVTR